MVCVEFGLAWRGEKRGLLTVRDWGVRPGFGRKGAGRSRFGEKLTVPIEGCVHLIKEFALEKAGSIGGERDTIDEPVC